MLDIDWLGEALDDIGEGDRILGADAVDSSKVPAEKVRFRVVVERAARTVSVVTAAWAPAG